MNTSSAPSLHGRPSPAYDAHVAEAIATLRTAIAEFGSSTLVQASSLGAEDVVLSHLIESNGLGIPLFVLDTGKLHPETQALLQATQQRRPESVAIYRPNPASVQAFVAAEGEEAMYRSLALRKRCCHIRKLEPLERALQGKSAWLTGLRREQSGTRATVPLRDDSEQAAGRPTKFNPLANWTWGDVWHYIATHQVPYNPLHDQFYPSIGCAPCTRAVTLGEDLRSGRWWWEQDQARECGLHLTSATASETSPASVLQEQQA